MDELKKEVSMVSARRKVAFLFSFVKINCLISFSLSQTPPILLSETCFILKAK